MYAADFVVVSFVALKSLTQWWLFELHVCNIWDQQWRLLPTVAVRRGGSKLLSNGDRGNRSCNPFCNIQWLTSCIKSMLLLLLLSLVSRHCKSVKQQLMAILGPLLPVPLRNAWYWHGHFISCIHHSQKKQGGFRGLHNNLNVADWETTLATILEHVSSHQPNTHKLITAHSTKDAKHDYVLLKLSFGLDLDHRENAFASSICYQDPLDPSHLVRTNLRSSSL
jgi:hypothetical protein